jgi:hypothetical protein
MPARRLGELLAHPGELGALTRQAQRLAGLQQVLFEAVPPPLARAARIKSYRAGTLFLLADNAAVAAKLRQLAPRLLVHVQERKFEVTGIRVGVQVTPSPPPPRTTSRRSTPAREAVRTMEMLAASLKDSPLRSALMRFVRRHKNPGA